MGTSVSPVSGVGVPSLGPSGTGVGSVGAESAIGESELGLKEAAEGSERVESEGDSG